MEHVAFLLKEGGKSILYIIYFLKCNNENIVQDYRGSFWNITEFYQIN